jgi:hypothetical protein
MEKYMNKIKEIDEYLKLNGCGKEQVETALRDLRSNIKQTVYPVCVLSHMYNKKRSKFLLNLINEERDRNYFIFTYVDQRDLYKQFEQLNNIEVVYIPLDNEIYLTLSGKRQYIMEWVQKNNYTDAFFIEDDCYNFHLPVGGIGGTGNFRNKKFQMSFALTFSLWELLIKKHNLTYSGPINNMDFTFRDLRKHPFIMQNVQVVQAIHINVESCKNLNISFNHNSGWDDYDMILQQCVYNKGTQGIVFSYVTPALKSGLSAMSENIDALSKRCEKNTTSLINKWGLSLVREDTKKGVYNAKVNWWTIKSAIKNNVRLSEIIKMTNDEAKIYIKQTKPNQTINDDW